MVHENQPQMDLDYQDTEVWELTDSDRELELVKLQSIDLSMMFQARNENLQEIVQPQRKRIMPTSFGNFPQNRMVQKSKSRILVIDDEPFNLKAMDILLNLASKDLNFQVDMIKNMTDFCSSGKEALEKIESLFRERKTTYGLVITDCSMPVMDGYHVSLAIRKFYSLQRQTQPYICACTGHSEEQFIQKAWSHLMDEVIPKPASKETIREILEQVITVRN
jgi:CheY-like chemotaxis protein